MGSFVFLQDFETIFKMKEVELSARWSKLNSDSEIEKIRPFYTGVGGCQPA
jgi:hypothetical protein